MTELRPDLAVIADRVPDGARVLDIGCGDGDLLAHLRAEKAADGRGIELAPAQVNTCLARGLSVIQGDANTDLASYPDGAFDVAILSQTIQATQRPDAALRQLLRIGKTAMVSLPNFAYWRVRLSLGLTGQMPVTASLPARWYETENIHLCTVFDFLDLCNDLGARVDYAVAISSQGRVSEIKGRSHRANLLAETAVFCLSRPQAG